ncbi:MAG TPA: NTP transferase domain-containing protein [Bacteroidales bacterium]|nr:NTP transferase domain-containing protein [Bacteroidales bacterium]
MIKEKEFSVIILSAGKSERMGTPKPALKFDESQTFIEHISFEYQQFGCKEIIIVLNKENHTFLNDLNIKLPSNCKIIINNHPEWHRFYSLKTGVKSLKEINYVFVHNVDNPFVNQEVLNELLNHSDKADYIVPEFEGKGGHPFLLSPKIILEITQTNKNEMHLKDFLNQYSKLKIQVNEESILVNINTLEDYKKYF